MVPAEGAFGDSWAAGAAWLRGGRRDAGRMRDAGQQPCSSGTGLAGDLLQRGRLPGQEETEPRAAGGGEAGLESRRAPGEEKDLPGGFSRPPGAGRSAASPIPAQPRAALGAGSR